jgi:hypothetical protein
MQPHFRKPRISDPRIAPFVSAALAAIVLSLLPAIVDAAGPSYYVSTSGSDSNPGTLGAPWRTVQHAANSVSAGATVYVFGGVYNEAVTFPASGTASAPITFESYPGQTAVLDGTGVKCCGASGTQGLITIAGNLSYITIEGFELRNYTTKSAQNTPSGVWITGSGTGVRILNNIVHAITTTSEKKGNAFGISAYGTSLTPITGLVISGNQVYDLKTGQSESVNVAGNVTYFAITNNLVHDNDNIGIDAIGYENVGPVGYDEAMYGEIGGNTVYNISGISNKGEGSSYDADGLYCDGCAFVTFENNWVFDSDYGIEVTSENQICQSNGTEWSGPNDTGTPGKGKSPCYGRYVTVRNNIFADSANVGMSIGGAKAATAKGGEETTGGSTYDAVFVNNTLYNNAKISLENKASSPGGEIQIQHQIGSGQVNYFENNLVYAGAYNHWIYSYVKSSTAYPAPPATSDWNLFYSVAGYVSGKSLYWDDVDDYATFADFAAETGEDENSLGGANPDVENVASPPFDLDIASVSPAVNAGGTGLTCSIGWCDPNGTSPNSIYGATDFMGNARTNGSAINIGAYEATGIAANALNVTLSAGTYVLQPGGSTTLSVTVAASPGGGGVPSGTVNFLLESSLLATEPLSPTGATTSAASLPLSASQLAQGSNVLTAVYSGNTIATGCCTASSPPGGGTQLPNYPSADSPQITITCGSALLRGQNRYSPGSRRSNARPSANRARALTAC